MTIRRFDMPWVRSRTHPPSGAFVRDLLNNSMQRATLRFLACTRDDLVMLHLTNCAYQKITVFLIGWFCNQPDAHSCGDAFTGDGPGTRSSMRHRSTKAKQVSA
jgi:hypothetical protein